MTDQSPNQSTLETPKFLQALAGKNQGRPPIWMMRQAGRTLASYRALRKGVPFVEFCKRVDLAGKATLLPVEELGVDAAILFADILLPVEALGIGLRFEEGIGPITDKPITDSKVAATLQAEPIENHCGYLIDIIQYLNKQLPTSVPLIGFCPSPWTLAAYMVEGQARKGFPGLKKFLYDDPVGFSEFMDLITELLCDYAAMQIQAGVKAFQIFDTWAELLPPDLLKSVVLPRVQKIADVTGDVPVIYFPKGTAGALPVLNELIVDGISCDWTVELADVRRNLTAQNKHVALQGNLDPTVLYAAPDKIQRATHQLLDTMAGDPAYVFNLGHGLAPGIPEDHVHAVVRAIKSWEPKA